MEALRSAERATQHAWDIVRQTGTGTTRRVREAAWTAYERALRREEAMRRYVTAGQY